MAARSEARAGSPSSSARAARVRWSSTRTSATSPARRCRRCTSPKASSGCWPLLAADRASMRRARPLLGTFVDISVDGGGADDMAAAVDAAFAAVGKVHRLMSFHDPASDVGRLNRDAAAVAIAVDPWTHEVITAAVDLNRSSNGLFDITVAPALQRLGLLAGPPPADAPSPTAGDAIEVLGDHRIRFCRAGTRIDLGGIAKGFAVDRAVAVLRAHGVPHGVVDAGGDLAAFGAMAAPVHIRDPRDPCRSIARIAIANEALASSGGRLDPFASSNAAAPAVIDARTGM